jgi:hypothetical protein
VSEFVKNQKPMSCINPPIGISVEYRNGSNIPINILKEDMSIYYGKFLIDRNQHTPNDNRILLAPGESTGITYIFDQYDTIRRMMINKMGIFNDPFLRLDFKVIISTQDTSKKYRINLIHDIGFDCRDYQHVRVMPYKASYDQIN